MVAMQDARWEKVVSASLPQLQYVSTVSTPSSEHLGSLALCFHTSASSAAAPTDMLAIAQGHGGGGGWGGGGGQCDNQGCSSSMLKVVPSHHTPKC